MTEEEKTPNDGGDGAATEYNTNRSDEEAVKNVANEDDDGSGGGVADFDLGMIDGRHGGRSASCCSCYVWKRLGLIGTCYGLIFAAVLVYIFVTKDENPSTVATGPGTTTTAEKNTVTSWARVGVDFGGRSESEGLGKNVVLSHGGSRVFATGRSTIRVYDRSSLQQQWTPVADLSGFLGTQNDSIEDLASSSDGRIVAVGLPYDNMAEAGGPTGMVTVLRHDGDYGSDDAGAWTRRGENLLGRDVQDRFGLALDLSHDGDVLAVGAYGGGYASVFDWDDTVRGWTTRGPLSSFVEGGDSRDAKESRFGYTLALSASGMLVVGAPHAKRSDNNSGSVVVFRNDSVEYRELQKIDPANGTHNYFGWSVSINEFGTLIAVGGLYGDAVALYRHDSEERTFVPFYTVRGRINSRYGNAVALSADGTRLAVGAWNDNEGGRSAGRAYVYDVTAEAANTIGTFEGDAAGDNFGRSVALSGSGQWLAVGADYDDEGGNDSGHVRVYKSN